MKSSPLSSSIRFRLLSALAGFAVIPLLLLGGVLAWQNYIGEINHVRQSLQDITKQTAANVSLFIHEQENKIGMLLGSNYLPEMPIGPLRDRLNSFLVNSRDQEHGGVFEEVVLLDAAGRETARASLTDISPNTARPDWAPMEVFRMPASSGKIYYSPVYFNSVTGEPMLDLGVPVMDLRTGGVAAVLVTRMKLKFLRTLVTNLKFGTSGIAYLTDSTDRVIVHPRSSLVLRNTVFTVPDDPGIMKGLNGEKVLISSVPISVGNQHFRLVTELPTTEALRHSRQSLIIIGTVLLLTLGGVGFFGLLIVRYVVRPVEDLAATARRISAGDLTPMGETTRQDEIGDLFRSFKEMTERLLKNVEDLEEWQRFIKNVFESLTHPFYVINADDHTVLMANSAANFGPLDANSKCHHLTHASDSPCSGEGHPCTINEVRNTRRPVVLRHDHCQQSKERRIIEIYGYPIFEQNGRISRIIEYNIDITEKLNLEEQLRQTQKLEAIGSLASGIAHDFNNILTAVIGYGELLIRNTPEGDPRRKHIESIYQAGEKASHLTRQLLAFSRRQQLEMRVVDINQLLENLTKMLGRLIGDNIEVKMQLQQNGGNIMADPNQIEQVIINLAVNARDAMPNGGRLLIETERTDLDEAYCRNHLDTTPGSYIALCVTDTGTGIPDNILEHIFEPFFTTKEKGHGTGLGLSTVYGIVKQHNGHIFVYSEPGKGTTFKVYLPEVTTAAELREEGNARVMQGGAETLLVVDDNESIRSLIRDTLEPLGYKVLLAGNGNEALELSRQLARPVDLLLTDVIMPGMNGRQLAEFMAGLWPDLKVLYMSGYTDDTIVYQGVLKPGNNFISKPLVPSLLTDTIRQVLDRNT